MLLLMLVFLFSSNVFANSEYKMMVCDNCSYQQAKSMAMAQFEPYQNVNVQIVNPSGGTVNAFNVYHESEPNYSHTEVSNISPAQNVLVAAQQAQAILNNMRASANNNPDIVDRARDLYPGNLPNHLGVVSIPGNIVGSASEINIGNEAHILMSQFVSGAYNIPLTTQILGFLFASFTHGVIVVFDDGSMMALISKASTIRYEPISGIYIDGNGNVVPLGSNIDVSNTGGPGDGSTYNPNSLLNRRLFCRLSVTYIGTTADGTYCESWVLY